MNINKFTNNFTKRWSTVFLALIAMTSIFFATYGAMCTLISDLFLLQQGAITRISNPFEIIGRYTYTLSPITSLIAYLFSIPSIIILKTHSHKLRLAMLSLIIIFIIIICKFSIPYITWGYGDRALHFLIIFILGSPILVLDFVIYFIIFYMENTQKIKTQENNITLNKYYKIIALSCLIFFFISFTPVIFELLIIIFNKTLSVITFPFRA